MRLFSKTLVAASIAVLASMSASAAPLTWRYNWAAADAAVGAVNTRPLSNLTNEVKFTAESVIRFNDLDSSGGISIGDTFVDYIVVRVDQLFIGGGNNGETGAGYGTAREITLTAQLTGSQVAANTYMFTSGGIFNFFYDSGLAFTPADFGALSTFRDSNGAPGVVVEQGSLVPPSGGTNNVPNLPDGTINVQMALLDSILPGGFEVNANGSTIFGFKLGIADGNSHVCTDTPGGTALCASTTASIESFFGAPALAAGQFQFHSRSDGSMTKQLTIPEPSSMALVGAALLGLGVIGRRRKS